MARTCKECDVEANKRKKIEVELRRENQDLKSENSFLKLSYPVYSSTDIILLIASDYPSAACIPAHKAVLVSRSPVFKAMLENDMEESRSRTIKIADVSYDDLRVFVNFLYTAEACLDNQKAQNLLILADKYQVKYLKEKCENYLKDNLTWEKVIDNFAFAYLHKAILLLDAVMTMIINNMHILTKNEGYAKLVEHNPRLVAKIFELYIAKRYRNKA